MSSDTTNLGTNGTARVTDFATADDTINILRGAGYNGTAQENFDLFVSEASQVGNSVVWTGDSAGNTITFDNLQLSDLSVDNFMDTNGLA